MAEQTVQQAQALVAQLRADDAEDLEALRRISAWVDEATRRAVRQARAGGATWEQIAEGLGLPVNTVWQRYRSEVTDLPAAKRYQCPYCSTAGTYRHNLRRHLMGRVGYGGHELDKGAADDIIAAIEAGDSIGERS